MSWAVPLRCLPGGFSLRQVRYERQTGRSRWLLGVDFSVPIRLSPTPTICMVWRQVAREADEAGMDVLQRQDLSFGAYILSLTGRVAGCRGPRLSCNAVAEAWFFRSWAVVLRSYRLTRARDCRSTRSTPSGPCSELLAMSPLPLTPSFTRAIGSTLNVVVVGDNRIGMDFSRTFWTRFSTRILRGKQGSKLNQSANRSAMPGWCNSTKRPGPDA